MLHILNTSIPGGFFPQNRLYHDIRLFFAYPVRLLAAASRISQQLEVAGKNAGDIKGDG